MAFDGGMALLILGGIIVAGTVYLMVKQYETRMVLFCAGLLMAIIAGDPFAAFKGFSQAMTESRVFEAIIAVMGFAMVLKLTECDKHLIYLLVKALKRAGPFLIPAATLVTFFINTSITSAAGCSAAVGAIIIPFLMAAGVHPAIAAAAVFAGTYGANFNPGYAQVAVVADVAKANPIDVVSNHFYPLLFSGIIGAFSLLAVAWIRKEHKGYVPEQSLTPDDFKVNYLKAVVPIVPLAILILGSTGIVPAFKQLAISHAMIIGVFITFIVTRANPAKIAKEFWHGAGDAFGHVFGIIICAIVFVEGMKAVGLVRSMMEAMTTHPAIAKISATFGPFLLAVMCGSGDAASVAFNKAVTIHAEQFGMLPTDMGSLAVIAGALGRSMSPIAGGAIICSAFAGINPMELAKRNALGMFIAATVSMLMLVY
jgi:DcuC family C4-dicarboxylate transporter